MRVQAYLLLMRDEYPPFGFDWRQKGGVSCLQK
jgi:hypothetical protein